MRIGSLNQAQTSSSLATPYLGSNGVKRESSGDETTQMCLLSGMIMIKPFDLVGGKDARYLNLTRKSIRQLRVAHLCILRSNEVLVASKTGQSNTLGSGQA